MMRRNVTTLSEKDIVDLEKPSERSTDPLFYQTAGKTKVSVIKKVLRHAGIKRLIDIIGAIVGLVIFSPVLIISIMLIYLSGSKKIFFKQERIGKFGKPFMLYKFTTMEDNAHVDAPLVSKAGDARITKIGKLLRMTNVNELPQFINVLKGEMSIVGPRPEVPKYVEYWSPQMKKKVLSVKPGITGYTTIKYWRESVILDAVKSQEHYYLYNIMPEKLRLDEWYVDNWNLLLDIKIMLETLYRAFSGARKGKSALIENIDGDGKMSVKQYRRYPRVPLNMPIYCKSINELIGYSRDVSFGGMFIELKDPIELEKIINVEFELPNQSCVIRTLAGVKWSKANSSSKQIAGVGVEFVGISPVEKAKLKSYIEDSLSNYVRFYSTETISC
jgi:lipopolysaccharide/colanic/teichoic acid biosynthesis glycosyltransferase/Tfp pilus assembly protein PilZ